jgi:hypothetical protein
MSTSIALSNFNERNQQPVDKTTGSTTIPPLLIERACVYPKGLSVIPKSFLDAKPLEPTINSFVRVGRLLNKGTHDYDMTILLRVDTLVAHCSDFHPERVSATFRRERVKHLLYLCMRVQDGFLLHECKPIPKAYLAIKARL